MSIKISDLPTQTSISGNDYLVGDNGTDTTYKFQVSVLESEIDAAIGQVASDAVASVNVAKTQAVSDVETKGDEVIASIPSDYTELSNEVTELKNDLSEIGVDYYPVAISKYEIGAYSTSDGSFNEWHKYASTPVKIDVMSGDIVTIKNRPSGYKKMYLLFWNDELFLSGSGNYFEVTETNEQIGYMVPPTATKMIIQFQFNSNVDSEFESYKTYLYSNEVDYDTIRHSKHFEIYRNIGYYVSDGSSGGNNRYLSINNKITVSSGDKITIRNRPIGYTSMYLLYWNDSVYLSYLKTYSHNELDIYTVPQNATKMMVEFSFSSDVSTTGHPDLKIYLNESLQNSVNVEFTFNNGDLKKAVDISSDCLKYANIIGDGTDVENFIFYTDPHLMAERQMWMIDRYMTILQKYYNSLPVDFIVCGGDWLDNKDMLATDAEINHSAKYKLSYINGFTTKMFSKHYMVIGNHDYNYQGYDEDGVLYHGELPNQVIINLWYREYHKAYYFFDGNSTRFYVLDTGIIDTAEVLENRYLDVMTNYRWEQIGWLASKLLEDDKMHSAIVMHIWKNGTEQTLMAHAVENVISAYNSRETITLNDVTYDFVNCVGHIEFVIAGHNHIDTNAIIDNNVPVIITTKFCQDNVPTFDIIHADYTNKLLYCIRAGSGSSRMFSLENGTMSIL